MRLLPIPDLEGYLVTDDGRIKSPTGRWLTFADNGNGYLTFGVQRRFGPVRRRYVHVAVCSAFHGPKPEPHLEVRHLDGNKSNNTPGNLAWGTRVQNRRDSLNPGHPPPRGKLTHQDVVEIRKLTSAEPRTPREKSIGHVNYAVIAKRYGVTPQHISFIASGEVWRYETTT